MRSTLPVRSRISSSAESWPKLAPVYPAYHSLENLRTITGLREEAIILNCRIFGGMIGNAFTPPSERI